jgi:hypothetical protein
MFELDPHDLVDLGVGDERAGHGRHRPVAHPLVAALAVAVAGLGELAAELATNARLLCDLPERAVGVRLAREQLALGE